MFASTQELINGLTESVTFETLRLVVPPLIKLRVTDNIIMLSTNRAVSKFTTDIEKESNGTIIDHCGKYIVKPTPVVNFKYKGRVTEENFSTFEVYEAFDGSVVNLYFNKQWCISTINGYCVNNYKRYANTTYETAINMCIGDNVQTLDENLTYTFGFRHADFHPLPHDAPKVWLLQVFDRSTQTMLPLATMEEIAATYGFGLQKKIEIGYNEMFKNNKISLNRYLQNMKNQHFGYILKHNNELISIESLLGKKIRQLIYTLPKGVSDVKYCALRAYMSVKDYKLFGQLFPQYAYILHDLHLYFNNLTTMMVRSLRLEKGVTAKNQNHIMKNLQKCQIFTKGSIELYHALFPEFKTLREQWMINPHDYILAAVIMDNMRRVEYLDMFYEQLK